MNTIVQAVLASGLHQSFFPLPLPSSPSDPSACRLDIVLVYEVYTEKRAALLYPVNQLRNLARLQVNGWARVGGCRRQVDGWSRVQGSLLASASPRRPHKLHSPPEGSH